MWWEPAKPARRGRRGSWRRRRNGEREREKERWACGQGRKSGIDRNEAHGPHPLLGPWPSTLARHSRTLPLLWPPPWISPPPPARRRSTAPLLILQRLSNPIRIQQSVLLFREDAAPAAARSPSPAPHLAGERVSRRVGRWGELPWLCAGGQEGEGGAFAGSWHGGQVPAAREGRRRR